MRSILVVIIVISSLFVSCAPEYNSTENSDDALLTLVPPTIDGCFFNRLITIEYDAGLRPVEIQATRTEYMGQISPCDYILLSPIQPIDPFLDGWAIYICPCTPDGDSDDLDSTIDNDPRLDQRENIGG